MKSFLLLSVVIAAGCTNSPGLLECRNQVEMVANELQIVDLQSLPRESVDLLFAELKKNEATPFEAEKLLLIVGKDDLPPLIPQISDIRILVSKIEITEDFKSSQFSVCYSDPCAQFKIEERVSIILETIKKE